MSSDLAITTRIRLLHAREHANRDEISSRFEMSLDFLKKTFIGAATRATSAHATTAKGKSLLSSAPE